MKENNNHKQYPMIDKCRLIGKNVQKCHHFYESFQKKFSQGRKNENEILHDRA